jgi:hypothetical protein
MAMLMITGHRHYVESRGDPSRNYAKARGVLDVRLAQAWSSPLTYAQSSKIDPRFETK